MKLKLLILCLSFFCLKGFTQIADGSVAPNFTATDLDGNSHTLQDYLDDGKTVILNISATWCGPCWNYKQTGALSDIHYAYGEDASDEVVVLYIEGDAATTTADLYGNGSNTIGDWVTTTPFPIIDNAAIANQYQISYYPTVYRICPDGFVTETGQLTSTAWDSNINANCGPLTGVDELAGINVNDAILCEDSVATDMDIELTNFGNNTMTSVQIDVNNGGNVQTFTETVSISKFGSTSVNINPVLDASQDFTFEISSVNGNTVTASDLSSDMPALGAAEEFETTLVELDILLDNYPDETTWEITDSSGSVVHSGGPYNNQQGQLIQESLNLDVEDCYTFAIFDAFGDGICCAWGTGSYSLKTSDGDIIASGGDFGSEESKTYKNYINLSVEDFGVYNFKMYPNPTDGELNLQANENFDFEVYTLQGKKVYQQEASANFYRTNLSELQSGIYLLKVNIDGISKTQKLIIK